VRTLFIDISNNSEVKILNTVVKKSVQILSAYYIANNEENDPVKIIEKKLEEESLNNIPAIIIPPRDIVYYYTFYFPVIPEREIKKILPRELRRVSDSDEEMIFDFRIGKKIVEKNEKKIEVIAYYMTKNSSWEMLEKFKAIGLNVKKIIPEVQSLEVFIKNSYLIEKNEKNINGIVIVDMMSKKINMNIFNRDIWSLNREFPFKVDENQAVTDKDFSRISTEFSRTFQYFKQKNKNVSIDDAIIFGSNSEIAILNDFINENQPLNSKTVNADTNDYKIIFPKNLKDKEEFVSIFFVSITTASSLVKRNNIDLYPKEYIEKEKFPKQIIIYSLISILVIVAVSIITFFTLSQRKEYDYELKKVEKEFKSLQNQINNIMAVRKRRKSYYEKIMIAESPKRISFQTADFIRRLSLLSDKDLVIRFSKLNILPKEDVLIFSITGSLYSDSINGSLALFDIFLKKLKVLKGIEVKNFTPPSSATLIKKKANLSWSFTVTGEKELLKE